MKARKKYKSEKENEQIKINTIKTKKSLINNSRKKNKKVTQHIK